MLTSETLNWVAMVSQKLEMLLGMIAKTDASAIVYDKNRFYLHWIYNGYNFRLIFNII